MVAHPANTLEVSFAALAFDQEHDLFRVQVHFDPTDSLDLQVSALSGSNITLNLKFTGKTIDIKNAEDVAAKLDELVTYLDSILQTAEVSAGLTTRLLAKPIAHRVFKKGVEFGSLIVTVAGTATSGPNFHIVLLQRQLQEVIH